MLEINRNIINLFCLSIFLILGNITTSYAACSPGIPCTTSDASSKENTSKAGGSKSCDSNFMNQIYGRAFLEASRETVMAEQIIHKPDSVLEYTCFDQFVSKAAHSAGAIFSESQAWGNGKKSIRGDEIDTKTDDNDFSGTETINNSGNDGLPNQEAYSQFKDKRLDKVLENFVLDALKLYIDNNFSHRFLGESTKIDNNLKYKIGSNAYNCSHMSTIWNVAKCLDFGEDDKFTSFANLASTDPRTIPMKCDAAGSGSANTGVSKDIITLASKNTSYDLDKIETLNNLIAGYKSGKIKCSLPLPTGVPVITYKISNKLVDGVDTLKRTSEFHYDHLCPNPGCYYSPKKVAYKASDPLPKSTSGKCVHY